MPTHKSTNSTKAAAKVVKVKKLPKNANLFAFATIALQKALKSFGKDGRYWIKGTMARNYKHPSDGNTYNKDFTSFTSNAGGKIANYKGVHPLYMCSMGAIMRADGPAEDIAARILADVIEGNNSTNDEVKDQVDGLALGSNSSSQSEIIGYNDGVGRKWPQIKSKFEAAIATAKLRAKIEELQRRVAKLT